MGAGWLIFGNLDVSSDVISWIMIIIGASVVVTNLFSFSRPLSPLSRAISSCATGLIIAMLFTSGFGVFMPWNWDDSTSRFTKEETEVFTGTIATQGLVFQTDIVNGAIIVNTWDSDDYRVELLIKGRGNTETEAQNNLDSVVVDLEETLQAGKIWLLLGVDAPMQTWSKVSVEVDVTLPEAAIAEIDVETTNGDVSLSDLVGESLSIGVTNGRVLLDGVEAEVITASTINGNVEGTAEAVDFSGSSTNGNVDITIPSTKSGVYHLRTVNGQVSATVSAGADVGVDFDLRTSIGSVSLDLSDVDYTSNTNRRKTGQTTGYSTKSIQIEIDASTTNGSCSLDS